MPQFVFFQQSFSVHKYDNRYQFHQQNHFWMQPRTSSIFQLSYSLFSFTFFNVCSISVTSGTYFHLFLISPWLCKTNWLQADDIKTDWGAVMLLNRSLCVCKSYFEEILWQKLVIFVFEWYKYCKSKKVVTSLTYL